MPGPGFLDHTQADDLLNATNRLPREVNLQVDKVVEDRIRPQSAQLTEKLSKSQITVQTATKEYVDLIHKIFNEYKAELHRELQQLSQVAQPEPWQTDRKNKIIRLIAYVEDELQGTQVPPVY